MDRPTKVFYAVVLWLAAGSMLALLASPLGMGLFAAIVMTMLWPYGRWNAKGWLIVPVAFVCGWAFGFVWLSGGLGKLAGQTPAWFDDFVLLPVSLAIVVWALRRWTRTSERHSLAH